jgi:hypothetical protein
MWTELSANETRCTRSLEYLTSQYGRTAANENIASKQDN